MAKKNNKTNEVFENEFTPVEDETKVDETLDEEETELEDDEVHNEEETEPVTLTGTVTTRLNIREDSTGDPNSKIVSIVDAGTTLTLYPEESNPTFFKVKTPAGVEGFAMRRYIIVDAETE